ncbi:CCA tRNA nucleotidyltransferase [Jannaschia sp. LMIT008]|uniref:CCA tRNA nucleotidyltransferase n=1 Tax=Jannaschia maritima TaxID=3032585 RepID=UPI002811ABB2|nr:CCA tRNA nucleotidyltransferase [Jannaschia sp. LMIT008]
MKVGGDWLEAAPTQAVFALLTDAGHQALAVGGCVRNAALDAAVTDIDLATDARPDRVVALADAAGIRAVPTGIDHGTITLIVDGVPHEVTTFRADVETDGRHAVVAFSDDVATDAARRDFTMNALYARADGTVVDPLDGLPDLRARRVRFIGDPHARIREDYLRILRFFRFTAWYGDPGLGIDADGLAACAELADGLDGLSRERVGQEVRKLLSAPDPAPMVATMERSGILARILPGAEAAPLSVLVHLEDGIEPAWIRRLALLGGEADDLRLSKAEARTTQILAKTGRGDVRPFVFGNLLGPSLGRDALLIHSALTGHPVAAEDLELVARGAVAKFPLAAADLMPALTGPSLGEALDDALQAWLLSDGALTKDDLLRRVSNHRH